MSRLSRRRVKRLALTSVAWSVGGLADGLICIILMSIVRVEVLGLVMRPIGGLCTLGRRISRTQTGVAHSPDRTTISWLTK